MATFQDYVNTIRGNILRPIVKIEWLRVDETVESELVSDILSGSLTINRNNGARRQCNFTVFLTSDLNPDIYGIWINKKFRLWLGYKTGNGDWFEPQGIFVLTNPVYESSGDGNKTATISGIDKFSLLNGDNGGILYDLYQIASGSNVNNVIRTILTDFKDPISPILQETSKTFPYTLKKGYGDNIGDALKDVAYFCARNIYYNTLGNFVFEDDMDDDKKGSLWDFNSTEDKYSYLNSSFEYKFDDVRNVVKVVGDNINGATAVGIAKNTNPASPTSITKIGEKPFPPIVSNYINNNTDAQSLAEWVLKRKVALNSTGSINCIPMFHLDVDKVITLTDANLGFNKERFLITNIDIDFSFGGNMTISVVKTDEPDLFIGSVN